MMTSVVSNPARGTRDRALPTTTQTTHPQKQIQATAEQIRLAQMIYDKNDADFEDKVKQLIEVTGKTQDECMVALHDCNEDVNRAINFLLESTSDTTTWETVGKKVRGKEGGPSEMKDNREKRGDREASRSRGVPNRRGRGANRSREVRPEENGFEMCSGDKVADRGRRGRGVAGRGLGGRGRGRAAGGNRFSSQGMGIFNPADYNANSSGSHQETWEAEGNEGGDGIGGTWRGNLEDWAAEDWNEDLSETKVFTASAPANHITSGHNVDMGSLLPKTGGVEADLGGMEPPAPVCVGGQSLVFTNSHHNCARTATHSYASAASGTSYTHGALSSVLGSGFGALSGPKPNPGEVRIPEQLNGPQLTPRTHQQLVTADNSSVAKESGPPAVQGSAPISASETKAPRVEKGPVLTSHLDLKMQPEPSSVLSQLAQRQQQAQHSSLPQAEPLSLPPQVPTPPGHYDAGPPPPRDGPSLDHQAPMAEPPQRQIKTQRRRVPPPSKIPSSAVEMPGSADVSGLNVQFGALDFDSEPSVIDMGHQAEPARDLAPTAVPQPQSSLFSKPGPVSEPLGSLSSMPPSISDPSFPSLGLPSATPSPSLGLPSAAPPSTSSASRVDNGPVQRMPPHLGYPQSKDAPAAPLTVSHQHWICQNGYGGVRTQGPEDSMSLVSRTPKPQSPPMSSDSGPVHHVPSPAPTPSYSAPLPSVSSHVTSTYSSGSALSTSSSLTVSTVSSSGVNMTSEESSSLHAFSSSSGPSINAAVSSSNGMMHVPGAPGLSTNGNTTLSAAGRTAQPQPLLNTTSGKAPPNLAQGLPPLLANQYIMGPGGLLPAYPQIYGYEDLQMLQSRLPMDYYGVAFPGTTATMPGRDGLANNPYSGEATKFGRGDSSSPAPPNSLSQGPSTQPQQPPQAQSQGLGQSQGQQNQAFLNPPLPPGYGYTGLPYYAGMPGVPSAFQYGPTVFVPPASAKQPNMGLGNPSSQYHQQHQPSYGQHAYGTAFDDLSQGHAGEYSKGGYGGSAQSQAKSAGSGPGKAPGLSSSGSSGGVADIGASMYSKTQSFDKQGFHAGTPPPFSLPSALGGTGPLNPGGAPGYAPPPFLHILPAHQQPHSQLLHHHLTQDGQGGPGQRNQSSSMQQKSQGSKSSYGSPYWAN
ncbi:ubiquitin-associated protein 2 isoform X1 [Oncorhynchus mykiss]|uniref:ubiquitin-associated protein 2 isoform X1 n=1 Tax=Oncorhynchus mykiss TaxID=8022 RepID=UPI00187844C8|nr:ubiquitin-associated protein 2 isoform X1 [Oncorhynchus mykiss]XP_021461131.2 ubiquitin-associated protein 2 isoform X1 [Oncorhynchus mykiss]XP_036835426.1 ubiquitin-associated protein 2 isoform X1 [Oncorhynchus mykiss]XP_036835427.1 ubiquitin-associated protein 2 isoform X1 [Oncorhynchus mykiss]